MERQRRRAEQIRTQAQLPKRRRKYLLNRRSAPDFSFDADPHSGVSVYDSTQCQGLSGWLVFGGTSVSSPSLAGIVNLAGHFYSSSTSELTTMYTNRTNSSDSAIFGPAQLGASALNQDTTSLPELAVTKAPPENKEMSAQ